MDEIIVETRKANGTWQTVYKGSDQKLAAAVVARQATLSDDALRAIGDTIHKKWVQLAQTSTDFPAPNSGSWRDVDYRADYLRGIQRPVVEHGKLTLSLVGTDANRVERGWAPPTTGDIEDGIGTYDGRVHDLRPWLFKFGRIHVKAHRKDGKPTKNAGRRYRNLRFIGPGMTKQIAKIMPLLEQKWQSFMAENGANISERALKLARARLMTRMANAYRATVQRIGGDSDDDGPRGEFTAVGLRRSVPLFDPEVADKLPSAMPHHRDWIYAGARAAASKQLDDHRWFTSKRRTSVVKHVEDNKTVWKVFRTIWEHGDDDGAPDNFMTKGIKPAKLITGANAPIASDLRKAIKDALMGRK